MGSWSLVSSGACASPHTPLATACRTLQKKGSAHLSDRGKIQCPGLPTSPQDRGGVDWSGPRPWQGRIAPPGRRAIRGWQSPRGLEWCPGPAQGHRWGRPGQRGSRERFSACVRCGACLCVQYSWALGGLGERFNPFALERAPSASCPKSVLKLVWEEAALQVGAVWVKEVVTSRRSGWQSRRGAASHARAGNFVTPRSLSFSGTVCTSVSAKRLSTGQAHNWAWRVGEG